MSASTTEEKNTSIHLHESMGGSDNRPDKHSVLRDGGFEVLLGRNPKCAGARGWDNQERLSMQLWDAVRGWFALRKESLERRTVRQGGPHSSDGNEGL